MRYFITTFLLFCFLCPSSIFAKEWIEEKPIGDYLPSNYSNLSRLMWVFDKYDVNDNEAMDAYIQISNCPLYERYFRDDFRLQLIREGIKRDILMFADSWSQKFYINAYVPLGDYDFEKAAYKIKRGYALDNAGTIKIPFYNDPIIFCGQRITMDYFPTDIKFAADNSFNLTHVPVKPELAQDLLDNIKDYVYGMSDRRTNNRIIPVRFKVNIKAIKDYRKMNYRPEVIYSGDLIEIAFYEDPQMTKLIFSKQFRE